ncbi:MAG: guanylate kinase [Polyangiaceae bacterium]|nr:guanylate kinase [Polyangiaceae bacterium]MCW5791133.1 guanylate kinase [Polyangiaceae bacterium]
MSNEQAAHAEHAQSAPAADAEEGSAAERRPEDPGPLLLILSSPSGAGKSTLTRRVREAISGLEFSVSHTTRSPRPGEEDGREYHFVSRADFEARVQRDEFLEWAEVHGNLYGTSASEVRRAAGKAGIIFDVDHQGARMIKAARPDAVGVFILPPSMEVLLSRLKGRASEDAATVERRFKVAQQEIAHYGAFEYVLVNDELTRATEELASIFRAEACRRRRAAHLAERLLVQSRRLSVGG